MNNYVMFKMSPTADSSRKITFKHYDGKPNINPDIASVREYYIVLNGYVEATSDIEGILEYYPDVFKKVLDKAILDNNGNTTKEGVLEFVTNSFKIKRKQNFTLQDLCNYFEFVQFGEDPLDLKINKSSRDKDMYIVIIINGYVRMNTNQFVMCNDFIEYVREPSLIFKYIERPIGQAMSIFDLTERERQLIDETKQQVVQQIDTQLQQIKSVTNSVQPTPINNYMQTEYSVFNDGK